MTRAVAPAEVRWPRTGERSVMGFSPSRTENVPEEAAAPMATAAAFLGVMTMV